MNKNENNMDSSNTNSRIPRLRFPGFTGEWEELPLSHFLFEHKTKSDGKCEVHSVSVTKGVVNQAAYLGRSYAAADTSKYNLAKPNDIIYTKSPTGAFPYGIVKQNKNPYNVIVSPLYAVYTPINKYIGYILDSYFESQVNTNNYLSSVVQKGAKNTIQITNDTFISKSVCFPTDPAEQQKIASCLSELDNLITAQGQKVDALKEKKKGLMQQLFPQKGETVPRLRFVGFAGDWEEKSLGEVFEKINNGMAYNTYLTEGFPMSRIETISSGEIDFDHVGYSDIEPDEKYKLIEGDILFSHINSETRIGRIALYRGGRTLYHGMNLLLLRASNLYDKYFVYYLMDRFETRTNIQKYAKKAINQASVSTSDIKQISVMIPHSIDEQQKIAECLSALDETITAEADKLEALKNHKKGLMQQLFPQPAK